MQEMWSHLTPLPPLTTLTDEGYERDALPTPKWTLTSTVDEDTDPIRASYILPSLPAYDEDDFREGLKSPLRPIKTGFEDSRDGKEEFDPISLALPYVGYLPPHVRYGVDIGESRGLKESGGLVGRNQAEGVVQDQGKLVGMGRDTSVSDRAGEDPWLLAGETVCDTRVSVYPCNPLLPWYEFSIPFDDVRPLSAGSTFLGQSPSSDKKVRPERANERTAWIFEPLPVRGDRGGLGGSHAQVGFLIPTEFSMVSLTMDIWSLSSD